MTIISPAQVATEVLNQGGSDQQAWVAAALVTGIESNGDPTDKNQTSTACGLFQFLDTTWASDGGSKYGPSACDATWQQQVTVFLNASQGNNFYPWAPDLGGSYNGVAIYAPQSGSKVAAAIASLNKSNALAFLGPIPSSWTSDISSTKGATLTSDTSSGNSGSGSAQAISGETNAACNDPDSDTFTLNRSGGCCNNVYLYNASPVHFINECQAQAVVGALLTGIGAIFVLVGLGLVLSDVGLRKAAPAIVGAVIGDEVGKRSASKPPSRSRQRNVESEARANAGQTPAAMRKATTRTTTVGRGSSNVHTISGSATPDF
jgi:hypothetical protein